MSSSWISFFPESTINNSQELVWKATERRGEKKKKRNKTILLCWTARFVLTCVGELLGVSCSLSLSTLPTELQPFLLSGDKSMIPCVLGCKDVMYDMTSPMCMWHPPTPLPFTSAPITNEMRTSPSHHRNFLCNDNKRDLSIQSMYYIKLSPMYALSLKRAKPINISMPKPQQKLDSLSNIFNTRWYHSYTLYF